jgi:hypothetical protein
MYVKQNNLKKDANQRYDRRHAVLSISRNDTIDLILLRIGMPLTCDDNNLNLPSITFNAKTILLLKREQKITKMLFKRLCS